MSENPVIWDLSAIRAMLMVSQVREFKAGQVLFRQGEVGDCIFLIRKGLVEIFAETSGRRRRLNLRGRGEVIGEMALLDGKGRSATAVARTKVRALSLDRENFSRLLRTKPELYSSLTLSLSARLRELQGTLGAELDRRDEYGKGNGLSSLGPFLLGERLGEGGAGVIYRASNRLTQQPRAVKVLSISTDEQKARFNRECETMARLIHPNIVRIDSAGLEGYYGYMAMELLQGETLDRRLERGPLSEYELRRWIVPAMEALHYAHGMGVVHRDIKPANLFIALDGTLKVLDFGIARRVNGPELTVAGRFFGTPRYLAPERIGGHSKSSERLSDQYSLGVVLYECTTGRCPFDQEDVAEVLACHLHRPPAPPHQVCPQLSAVILRMMAKEPGKRFRDFQEAAAALTATLRPSEDTNEFANL